MIRVGDRVRWCVEDLDRLSIPSADPIRAQRGHVREFIDRGRMAVVVWEGGREQVTAVVKLERATSP